MAIYVQLEQRRRHVDRHCSILLAVERGIAGYNEAEREAGGFASVMRFEDRVRTLLREPPRGSELGRWLAKTAP